MFGWFKRKEPKVPVKDIIFMGREGKYNHLLLLAAQQPAPVFVCWFDDTIDSVRSYLEENGITSATIIGPREVMSQRNASLVFCEHHPSGKTEQERYRQWGITEATVVSSMDEPMLQIFGGDHIISMMKNLGIKETEAIQHKMISHSIKRAQQKIDEKAGTMLQQAYSQKEWMTKNIV